MSKVSVVYNDEKKGIELYFDCKPDRAVLAQLKADGFRWHNAKRMWYAKRNKRTDDLARELSGDGLISNTAKKLDETATQGLWELTRTDGIRSNMNTKLREKDVASRIRSHLRQRFPMCRFSVTSGDNRVYIEIKSSPFYKESEELKAIDNYAMEYAKSFRYRVDLLPNGMRYGPYNFYLVANGRYGCCVSWLYEQTEITPEIKQMCADFQTKKAEFDRKEEERKEAEMQETMRRMEIERQESERIRKLAAEKRAQVEANFTQKEVDYYMTDLLDCGVSKCSTTDEYRQAPEEYHGRCMCRVAREIRLSGEMYDIFSKQLLADWSFVAGMGCSETQDERVNSVEDYNAMTAEERKTVKWYCAKCVVIYCEDVPMLVVDPQGYDYCRYVYFVDAETKRFDSYEEVAA